MMTFHLGTTRGEYEIIDVVESSKTHTTYKVKNKTANRFEALRVLTRTAQDDNDSLERFVREMKVHARLAHPNIVTFFQATQLEGHAVMTTELLEGITLDQMIRRQGIPVAEAAKITCQILDALDCAHQHGIVHREITPANVFVTPEGSVKLTGFSMAKSAMDPQLTQVGAVMGSVWYMSPEQVRGVGKPEPATDIYAAGVILYELVTGRRPFDSQSHFEVMTAHVTATPKAPSEVNPAVPVEFDPIVLKALAKDAQARYASAQEFRAILSSFAPAKAPASGLVAGASKGADPAPEQGEAHAENVAEVAVPVADTAVSAPAAAETAAIDDSAATPVVETATIETPAVAATTQPGPVELPSAVSVAAAAIEVLPAAEPAPPAAVELPQAAAAPAQPAAIDTPAVAAPVQPAPVETPIPATAAPPAVTQSTPPSAPPEAKPVEVTLAPVPAPPAAAPEVKALEAAVTPAIQSPNVALESTLPAAATEPAVTPVEAAPETPQEPAIPAAPAPPQRNLFQMAIAGVVMFVVCIVWYYMLGIR